MATNANEILDRLAALLDAATPGPMTVREHGEHVTVCISTCARKATLGNDIAAIVALRNAAPALIRLARAAIAVKDWKGDTSLFDACEEHEAALKALGEVRL